MIETEVCCKLIRKYVDDVEERRKYLTKRNDYTNENHNLKARKEEV